MQQQPLIFLEEGTTQHISIGLKDKKGKPLHNLDYVKLDISIHGVDFVYGQIIYGYLTINRDEWDVHHKTMGFGVKYKDGSGTTGITSDWELTTKEEYERRN